MKYIDYKRMIHDEFKRRKKSGESIDKVEIINGYATTLRQALEGIKHRERLPSYMLRMKRRKANG